MITALIFLGCLYFAAVTVLLVGLAYEVWTDVVSKRGKHT